MEESNYGSAKIIEGQKYTIPVAPTQNIDSMMQSIGSNAMVDVRKEMEQVSSAKIVTTDQTDLDTTIGAELGFPWSRAEYGEKAIGTLFAQQFTNAELEDMHERTQLGSVIINAPVEDSFANGFRVVLTSANMGEKPTEDAIAKFNLDAQKIFKKDKTKILRFFKLSRLYGFSLLLFGYRDDRNYWATHRPTANTPIDWVQPVPKPNVQELKTNNALPLKIEYVRTTFGTDVVTLNPTRFLHTMMPRITREDKIGLSALAPIINLLTVQLHADWSIGQGLWRNSSRLYALQAPRKTLTPTEKLEAISGTANLNARTVLYLPHAWGFKDVTGNTGNVAVSRTYRTIVEQISAGSRIPVSILLGSQKGALDASGEDKENYYRFLGTLQENTYEPQLQEYFRHYQRSGRLSGGEFIIEFNDLEPRAPKVKALDELKVAATKKVTELLKDPELFRESGMKAVDLVKLITTK